MEKQITKFDLQEFKKRLKLDVDNLIEKKEQALQYNYTSNRNNKSSFYNQLIDHREKIKPADIQDCQ
jgi:hypothetical protein